MTDLKQAVHNQFDRAADHYRRSQVHALGEDLSLIAQRVQSIEAPLVLDAGCGAGHTSFAVAPHSQQVTAFDLTAGMLAQVMRQSIEKGLDNIQTRQGDVEAMPFEDNQFHIVVSRYSAHHWPHPQQALREIRRVLKPDGRFILSDVIASEEPALDTFLQTLELLRDRSHIRDHRISQWQTLLTDVGFESTVGHTWSIDLEFEPWLKRIATPAQNAAMLRSLFDGASREVKAYFQLEADYQFSLQNALFEARLLPV